MGLLTCICYQTVLVISLYPATVRSVIDTADSTNCITSNQTDYASINLEAQLNSHLFRYYEREVRPVIDVNTTVTVEFDYHLLSIQLDEVNQVLTSFAWLTHSWRDQRLAWDPQAYGNVTGISVSSKVMWYPDTHIYDSVSEDPGGSYVTPKEERFGIDHSGDVLWWPGKVLKTQCEIDITFFPFDYQQCSLLIGPWSYQSFQVRYILPRSTVNLDSYKPSGTWQLTNTSMVVFDNYFPSIGQSFTCVKVTFELRRKPRYFWLNIIIPCLLLNGIGLGVFILPVGSGEKVSFGLGILLTVFVFAILVNEYIPKTSDYTSVLGMYLTVTMCILSLAVFLAAVLENLHQRKPELKPVPAAVASLFLRRLPKYLGINLQKLPLSPRTRRSIMKRNHRWLEMSVVTNSTNGSYINESTDDTTTEVNNLAQSEYKRPHSDSTEKSSEEWILIAIVLDSLLFRIFLVLLILTTCIVFIVPTFQFIRHAA